MATGYPYKSLDRAQQEIRLLCFDATTLPDSTACFGEKPLNCTIRTLSTLPDPLPEYYAISYTWGDSKTRGELVVDGENVTIPANAETALRHLLAIQVEQRRNPNPAILTDSSSFAQSPTANEFDEPDPWPSTEIRFWLDAICINQHDFEEKSWQLLLISDIYSQAQEVSIWLGEDADGMGRNISQSISSVVAQCKEETNDLAHLFETVWSLTPKELSPRSVSAPLPTLSSLDVLRSLYSSPWFQRLWVLQECILARNPKCYRGSYSFPFREVALAGRWIWYMTFGRLLPGDDQYTAHAIGIQNAATMWDMMSTPFIVPRVLSNLVLLATRFDVTDPRDRVYAILGLLNDADFAELEEGLLPDYSVSLAALYTRVTRAVVQETGSLFIMRIGSTMVPGTGRGGGDALELPSWVPRFDWVYDVNKGSSCAIRSTQRAERSQAKVQLRVLEGLPDVLAVQGMVVDTIRCTIGKCLMYGKDSIATRVSEAWQLVADNGDEKNCGPLEEAFALTICAGRNKFGQDLNDDHDFNENCAAFFSTCRPSCRRLSDYFSRRLTNGKSHSHHFDRSQEIPKAMAQYSRNLRFFVTSHGRLGLGAKLASQDDTVCLVPGCDVPVILRREGAFWRYVGDVFVCGLMNGTCLQRSAKSRDGEAGMRWFNIQ